ncbi:hypothetical protein PDESU_02170 [Pontiella desulfatans]|uniref:Uncharacterized protein n=1 Tax=Pontiella desulfatans TaxID=2750659 RepID=A0A6C2U163_PONDE|nr:hypothetical protein [Pontiella desulfatans]VGO13613.1 hypothetical protein PDESU_02170 [Pontiella desulfatans]
MALAVGEVAGGGKYPEVSKMVKRFEERLQEDKGAKKQVERFEQLLNV